MKPDGGNRKRQDDADFGGRLAGCDPANALRFAPAQRDGDLAVAGIDYLGMCGKEAQCVGEHRLCVAVKYLEGQALR